MTEKVESSEPLEQRTHADVIDLAQLCLRFARVNRATYHEDGVRTETDADHTVMLGIIGCAFAARFAAHLDLGLVAQFAFVHDLVEAYAGDTNTLKISAEQEQTKISREAAAFSCIKERFGAALPWVTETIEHYERLDSQEARFIKTLDKVLPMVTHVLNRGATLNAIGVDPQEFFQLKQAQYEKLAAKFAGDQLAALELYRNVASHLRSGLASGH